MNRDIKGQGYSRWYGRQGDNRRAYFRWGNTRCCCVVFPLGFLFALCVVVAAPVSIRIRRKFTA